MKRIEQMYAFVMNDGGSEGVPAFTGPGSMVIPLVGADMARVDDLRPMAQAMARATGNPVTLCRFEVRTELEVLEP